MDKAEFERGKMQERPSAYFERNTDFEWTEDERIGFDHGYGEEGYKPEEHTESEEWYDTGFINGAYARLDEKCSGLSEATAQMHTNGKSSDEDCINWLFLPVESKLRWGRAGELDDYANRLREGLGTIYG